MMAKLLFILSILQLTAILILLPPSCYPKHTIIAVLPLEHTDLPTLSWERGLEILPGAEVAIEHLNQYYNVSPEHQLELKVINSGKCTTEDYREDLVIHFLNLTERRNYSQIAVIGLFCSHTEQLLLNVAERIGINPILVSSSVSITSDSQTSKYHHILPSTDSFIDAFSSLIGHLKHNRIAVIAQPTDSYFFRVAEALYDRATSTNAYKVIPFIQLHTGRTAESVFQELQQFSSNIIFLSANIDKSIDILCTAKRMGFIWPHYGWVVHSIRLGDFIAAELIAKCSIYYALEGVLLLSHKLNPLAGYATDHMFSYFEEYDKKLSDLGAKLSIPLSRNPYSIVLYNLVWVHAMDVYTQMNNSSPGFINNIRYAQTATAFNFTNRVRLGIDIYLIKNGTSILEGYYDHIWRNITFTGTLLNGPIPSDNHKIITDRASLVYASIASIVLLVCTILVTIILILYIYYFKEPEIKSTSVSLSLLMFFGCYIILLYLLLALIYTQSLVPSDSPFNICTAIIWLSITGVSLPLILATLMVKMLRVFHIFNLYGKISKMCSNSALLVYVFLLISPCVLILIFWTAVDPYTARTIAMEHFTFTEIEQRCTCKYLLLWIGLLLINILILITVLLIVAVKTRKIRQAHFKDTKKVNAFLFLLVTVIFLTLAYWMIFRTIGAKKGYSDITLHVAHIIIVASCQGFLFIPKVLPPLMRSVSKKYGLKWSSASNSSKTHTTTVTLAN